MSPDIIIDGLWTEKIIPGTEKLVSSPLIPSLVKGITERPISQTLGFAISRVLIQESRSAANTCKKLVPVELKFDKRTPDTIITDSLDLWFSYPAVAVHIATRIEQGLRPDTPLNRYYDPKDPIKPSANAIEMLRWCYDPRNFSTLMAIDQTGFVLVEYILKSRNEPFRREDIDFNHPAVLKTNQTNRLVELGAQRFVKYLRHFLPEE